MDECTVDPIEQIPISAMERYTYEGTLGKGGFGEVHRVKDKQLGRAVALKVLQPPINRFAQGTTEEQLKREERFLREAQTLSRVGEHPHLPTIYEVHTASTPPWIAMQYVEGQNITEWRGGVVDVDNPQSLRGFLKVAIDVTEALCHLHAVGVIHRDVKPGNILVTSEGRGFLVDLGIVKIVTLNDDDSQLTTEHQSPPYSPAYAPMEQIRGGVQTEVADVYSLGVVLYEALTGINPFYDEVPSIAAAKHGWVEPPPPHIERTNVSQPLSRLITTMISREPEDRPTSSAVLETLREMVASTSAPARNHWRPVAIVGLLGAATLGFWAISSYRSESPTPTVKPLQVEPAEEVPVDVNPLEVSPPVPKPIQLEVPQPNDRVTITPAEVLPEGGILLSADLHWEKANVEAVQPPSSQFKLDDALVLKTGNVIRKCEGQPLTDATGLTRCFTAPSSKAGQEPGLKTITLEVVTTDGSSVTLTLAVAL